MKTLAPLFTLVFTIGLGACATKGAQLAPVATPATPTSVLVVHDTKGADCFFRLHSTDATAGRSFRINMKPGAGYSWAAVPPGEYELRGVACYNGFDMPNAVSRRVTVTQGKVNYLGGLYIEAKTILVLGSDPASLSRLRTAMGGLGSRSNDLVSGFSKTAIGTDMTNEKIPILVSFVMKEPKSPNAGQRQAKEAQQQALRDQVQDCLKAEDARNLVLLGQYDLAADYAGDPPRIDVQPTGRHTLTEPFTACIAQALRAFRPARGLDAKVRVTSVGAR